MTLGLRRMNDAAMIYLPGFNSGPQSEKSALLKQQFSRLVTASYDSWHPERGFAQIDELVQSMLDQHPLLIGSSLGGFWAYQFANRYNLKCVLLNPCMTPEQTLRPYVGEVEHMYTGEKGVLTLESLQQYPAYRIAGNAHCTVLHETGDEVIPFHESVQNFAGKAKLVVLPGGNHRFEQLDEAVREIIAIQRASASG